MQPDGETGDVLRRDLDRVVAAVDRVDRRAGVLSRAMLEGPTRKIAVGMDGGARSYRISPAVASLRLSQRLCSTGKQYDSP